MPIFQDLPIFLPTTTTTTTEPITLPLVHACGVKIDWLIIGACYNDGLHLGQIMIVISMSVICNNRQATKINTTYVQTRYRYKVKLNNLKCKIIISSAPSLIDSSNGSCLRRFLLINLRGRAHLLARVLLLCVRHCVYTAIVLGDVYTQTHAICMYHIGENFR